MIGEVGKRVAERGQLPIEHRNDRGRVGRNDHVVETIIAMHHPRRLLGRQMGGEPVDQSLHVLDPLGLGRPILLRPARDLARHVILAAAVIAKTDCRGIERMQTRQRRIHAVVNLRAFCRVGFRHVRLPKNAAVGESHDKERSADNTFVLAIEERLGDRKALRVKSADHPIFAIDRMRGRQQLAGRLSAQDVTS